MLAAAARGLTQALREHVPRTAPYWLRQGIANLFRPKNQTLATTLTLGFGLFLVASVQLLQNNLLTDLRGEQDPERPNLVLFDVQRDQAEGVRALLEERGTLVRDQAAMVPARIGGLHGQRAEDVLARAAEKLGSEPSRVGEESEERSQRWALRREYRLSYRAELRDTERVVAGTWWEGRRPHPPPANPPPSRSSANSPRPSASKWATASTGRSRASPSRAW